MKNIIFLGVISLLLCSCKGGQDQEANNNSLLN